MKEHEVPLKVARVESAFLKLLCYLTIRGGAHTRGLKIPPRKRAPPRWSREVTGLSAFFTVQLMLRL